MSYVVMIASVRGMVHALSPGTRSFLRPFNTPGGGKAACTIKTVPNLDSMHGQLYRTTTTNIATQ